jgi:hypothetical protein
MSTSSDDPSSARTRPAESKVPEELKPTVPASRPAPVFLRAALLPVPDAVAQQKAEKLVRELFSEDYAQRTSSGRQALAKKLLRSAGETKDDSAALYVQLREATALAAGAGDAETALSAIDTMNRVFVVDAIELKLAALTLADRGTSTTDAGENARKCLQLSHECLDAENYDAAIRFATFGETAARRGKENAVASECKEAAASTRKLQSAAVALAKDPKDRAANSTIGAYVCFTRGDWAKGLPMLALGSDPALAALANRETKPPAESDAQLELANAWWEVAQKQTPAARATVEAHAGAWYRQALPGLKGLSKTLAEKRVATAPPLTVTGNTPPKGDGTTPGQAGKIIKLLPLFDVKDGPAAGVWTVKAGALVADDTNNARIQSKYRPPAEYDFVIEFTRPKGTGNIVQLLARGDRAFEWSIAAAGDATRLQDVGGHARNGTQRPMPAGLNDANRHTSVVQVRNAGMKILLDGKEVLNFPTDYSNLSRNGVWKLKDDHFLGLGTWGGPIHFHRVEVIEVGGTTAPMRAPIGAAQVPAAK